jgi:ribosomal protein S18 acetylase RimI-like enzyme
MRQLVTSRNAATWIAEKAGEMVGFAIVEWTQEPGGSTAYIQTIEVAPEYRGQGIGGELLRRIEDSARAADALMIGLHVDEENTDAIRIYQAHGYLHQGRQEDYYGLGRTALIYGKPLEPERSS